ncbi:hypothetical protein [Saccharopolyspora spinosa]|uniref:Secreted protein n=1 Tax=Saccharopolyspora spinosa TaxID=60894 RepID=A0A2N3XY26_SACSN|nr:hypothetical protein [Saccharopolyspora spinosa]PKW15539.1 hypothetical protein A8926_3265 [Saccharopolyspora spinosa]
MRRPLITALLSGLVMLGAVGTAAAAERPSGLDKILTATVLDVATHDGESQNGTAHTSSSSQADPESQAKPQPPAKPASLTKPESRPEAEPQAQTEAPSQD